jgi:hypothetical protein
MGCTDLTEVEKINRVKKAGRAEAKDFSILVGSF